LSSLIKRPLALALLVAQVTTLLPPAAQGASKLPLDTFLKQVQDASLAYSGATLSSQGARERSEEAALVTAPQAFANLSLASDARKNPFFFYDRVLNNVYGFGVQQQNTVGTQWKLSYQVTFTDFQGLRFPSAVTTFNEGRLALEVNQPLWKNALGFETRAQQDALEAQALASHHVEAFKARAALAEAEATYWSLALARRTVTIAQTTLERARVLHAWASKRARFELADKSDLFQAEAALELRKLQLRAAEDQAHTASRAFNAARQVASDTVTEELELPELTTLLTLQAPARSALREDVLAAREGERAAVAVAEQGRSRAKPQLDVFASAALNSRDAPLGTAIANSFTLQQPTVAAGVKLVVPLDIGSLSAASQGWAKERAAAEKNYTQKVFTQEKEWADLEQGLKDARKRLELAAQIEDIQKKKLLNERERLNRGRTVTYQVLMFEEDFSQAQLNRLRTQGELLSILARMKTFQAGQAGNT
jgi:outer membrane protein TolC